MANPFRWFGGLVEWYANQNIPSGNSLTMADGSTFTNNSTETVSVAKLTTLNVGAVNGATVTAVERGDGILHQTVLTLTATPLTVRDTEQGNGVKIYDFPAGVIHILGCSGSMAFTTTSALATTLNASVSCRWGVGTVTQANATLATTEQDIVNVTTFTSSATVNVANTATGGVGLTAAIFNGITTAIDAFMNVSVPTAGDIDGDATITMTGTVTINWIHTTDVTA